MSVLVKSGECSCLGVKAPKSQLQNKQINVFSPNYLVVTAPIFVSALCRISLKFDVVWS